MCSVASDCKVTREERRCFRRFISHGDLCFDVGANIGDYTASLLALGARVVAVEPQTRCLTELHARFAGNRRVSIMPVALGSTEGTAKFYLRKYHETSGLLQNWKGSVPTDNLGMINVPVQTLANLCTRYGIPRYIKIDVEGYELEVVSGLTDKIDLLSFEYHLWEESYDSTLEIINRLSQLGSPSFNLLPEDADDFVWAEFVSLEEFKNEFRRRLDARTDKYLFGDVFVRLT